MKVYEIFIAELGTYVKFKVIEPAEVELFVSEISEMTKEEYFKKVLENVVFNFKTEVIESLKMMTRANAKRTVEALFNGCVMLNPGLDIETWVSLAYASLTEVPTTSTEIEHMPDVAPHNENAVQTEQLSSLAKKPKPKRISKAKFMNLGKHLRERVIGQDEAIDTVVNALKRSQVGLNDEGRPLGVFLFAGSSGVGKTHLARELHKYLYGDDYDIVRLDCGEFQHKHDNQKLLGSPPGYVGHDEGGYLVNALRANPDTIVLLDEVEKAHADIWNTFLRVFDEGVLTDNKGRKVDFRNSIIIMTTNLGNEKAVEHLTSAGVGFGARLGESFASRVVPPREQTERYALEAIKKSFRPEFQNRIDETVVFNYLTLDHYRQIADLEMRKIEDKLSKKGIILKYEEDVLDLLVDVGVDSIKGARGMSKVRQNRIENTLADLLLDTKVSRGVICDVLVRGDDFFISLTQPKKKEVTDATAS